MNSRFKLKVITAVAGLALLTNVAMATDAKPVDAKRPLLTPVAFDVNTWKALSSQGPKPAAYVFTTTHCVNCPEAIETIATAVANKKLNLPLSAIVMDADPAQSSQHAAHLKGITKLYFFDGFEAKIRYSVDPTWRNITPFVILIDKNGGMQKILGAPSDLALKDWLDK